MKLRLVVPHLESNFNRAVLSRWHVAAGTDCVFGQAVCDLVVTERVRLRSTRRADVLAKFARQGKGVVEDIETDRDRFVVTYRILASEPARITELRAASGDTVSPGGLLAIAETASAGADVGAEDLPLMRAVAVLANGSEGV